jgi:hypothetical protein
VILFKKLITELSLQREPIKSEFIIYLFLTLLSDFFVLLKFHLLSKSFEFNFLVWISFRIINCYSLSFHSVCTYISGILLLAHCSVQYGSSSLDFMWFSHFQSIQFTALHCVPKYATSCTAWRRRGFYAPRDCSPKQENYVKVASHLESEGEEEDWENCI